MQELVRVGPVAIGGGLLQVLLLIGIGYLAGIALGWSTLEALFLGAVVSNSSSTVLGKILGERGETGSLHGRVALAWSSVQDLSTIALVVVLEGRTRAGRRAAGRARHAPDRRARAEREPGPAHRRPRTHSAEQRAALQQLGVDEPVLAEFELALEMARFTLHRWGLSTLDIESLLEELRDGR